MNFVLLLIRTKNAAAAVTSVVSDSVRPQRRQATRLPRPWDSPGKNTGVGCYCYNPLPLLLCCSEAKSCLALRPHGLQHARSCCASLSPRVGSNACPLSRWCHPTISSSVVPFSSCLQSFPASGSFPMSQFFGSGGQSTGVSASPSVLPMNIQDWSPLGWTSWISLQSKGLSRVFCSTTVQKHQFFGTQLYDPTLTSVRDYWKNHSFNYRDLCWQSDVSAF